MKKNKPEKDLGKKLPLQDSIPIDPSKISEESKRVVRKYLDLHKDKIIEQNK